MNIPTWFKPAVVGALFGAGALSIIGFGMGGWMTASTGEQMAERMASERTAAAMAPVCVDMAQKDPQRAAKMTTIEERPSYKREQAVMDAGWATMPGADSPDRGIAGACLAALEKEL